ncbi:alpha/beta hydrolase family esterase [Jejuia pallidilutea]|uniref:alpha/beta hydrolase family esterase n=1 Tax=Jejuia pallidilutea TaxID=504487 RepID=UPI0005A8EEBF|nr:PHB depolymerase family esterase [Jejuia pallidilutea]
MKNLYLLLVLFCCLNCDNSDNKNEPRIDLEFYDSLIFDGAERTYFVHLPVNYNDTKKYPLIFAMHGGGVLGYEGVMGQSELSELSDDENFIVVYPEGIRTLGFRTWNAGDCCPSATLLNTNDVGFIDALLEKLKNELPIDAKRVYATGFSNGGQLAYRLANELPNKFAAVSSVAGVLQSFPFNPTRNVPIIHFHSYLDPTAPYNGGLSDAPNINNNFPSVEDTLTLIANQYGCDIIKETLFSNSTTYDHFRYSDCNENVLIELYVSKDGGHSWPDGQAFSGVEITRHFNASKLMWDFFKNYQLE